MKYFFLACCPISLFSLNRKWQLTGKKNQLKKAEKHVPPSRTRLCTEIMPSEDVMKSKGLSAGILSALRWRWSAGAPREISIAFADGNEDIKKRVRDIAQEWEPVIGAKFKYTSTRNADITISFAQKGVSWSRIGTDSRSHSPSMNFGWLEDEAVDSLFKAVVLHEFGHAIGLVHEHQLKNGNPVKWNVSAVYSYYMGYPHYWSKQDIEENIFNRYSQNQIIGGRYDPHSIMLYHIPSELTTDGYSTPVNVRLSNRDRKVVSDVYLR